MDSFCDKIARFEYEGSTHYGFLKDDTLEFATGKVNELVRTGKYVSLDMCKLLAPILPGKIIVTAKNYNPGEKTPRDPKAGPVVIFKPLTTVIGPGDEIVYPRGMSDHVHYEAKVAIVIGKQARKVSVSNAEEYILGFTLVNDVTDRDNMRGGQLCLGKSHDTFLPIGPVITVSRDCSDVSIKGYLNGKLVQDGSWEHLIYSPQELIEELSSFMTLEPGDLICAGTPEGGSTMAPGDIVTVSNEYIGELTNKVV